MNIMPCSQLVGLAINFNVNKSECSENVLRPIIFEVLSLVIKLRHSE